MVVRAHNVLESLVVPVRRRLLVLDPPLRALKLGLLVEADHTLLNWDQLPCRSVHALAVRL
eukprot:3043954-Prorocentrum_lima.AAC.1